MKIVTTSGVFPKETDTFEIITKLANLGFDGIDFAFDYCSAVKDSPFNGDNYLEWAKMLREKANSLGVSFLASHASFDAHHTTASEYDIRVIFAYHLQIAICGRF